MNLDAPTTSRAAAARQARASLPLGSPWHDVAQIFARGYLRLLAKRAADVVAAAALGNSPKPVDSVRAKSVNWLEHEGGRDA